MVSALSPTERDEQLPSYSDVQNTARVQPSRGAFRTKHSYSLESTKGRPWLSLNVSSRAVSSRVLPVFRDGDEISGEVKVDLDKPESYKGVTVGVVGEYTTVGQESMPFLDLSSTLWTPTSSSDKLTGSHTWPFSLSLPREVQVSSAPRESAKSYPLPPTFSERASPAYIDYKIIVTVRRGLLKVNQTLSTSFAYVPRWVAPSPSPLRIAAYTDGSPLLGPEVDLDGWKVLPPIRMAGTLFDTKPVEVEMTLSLATPLSYALGSPIPLHLALKTSKSDPQALDILSQPSSQSIFLTRTKVLGSTATADDSDITQTTQRRSNNTFEEQVGRAYWWPYIGEEIEGARMNGESVRVLMGEIDVPKTLNPSFVFPRFSIRYHISIFPISAPGFSLSPSSSSSSAHFQHKSRPTNSNSRLNAPLLHTEKISIVTDNAPGVLPRSHAPPGYIKPEEGNYNNSMGYLENGNQRFYGHHR